MKNSLKKKEAGLTEGLAEILSSNMGGQELQERVTEYVKVKKLEEKIAREILELWENQSKTVNYVKDLSALISELQKGDAETKEQNV
jgi:hypothetical protein